MSATSPAPATSASPSPSPKLSSAAAKPGFFQRLWNLFKRIFGKHENVPANHAPVVSLAASPQAVTLACVDVVSSSQCSASTSFQIQLNADARDPDNDTVLYTWSVTGGTVSGEGKNVTWDLAGLTVGTYTATVEVNDGNGHLAHATTTVTVATCQCEESPCPAVTVSGFESVNQGDLATFTATEISQSVTYNWSVSAGRIVSGQGTPAMSLDTESLGGQAITVTLEVGGLRPDCGRTATVTTRVAARVLPPPGVCRKLDRYGNIKFSDEQDRLNHLAGVLQAEPDLVATIVATGSCEGQGLQRARRAMNYLVGKRSIDAARITLLDGGCGSESVVELFACPPAARLAMPRIPTVCPPCREGTIGPQPPLVGHSAPRTAAALTGAVQREDGTLVAGAMVTLARDGFSTKVTSDERGHYAFDDLPPGVYELKITGQGFGEYTAMNVVVGEGANALPPSVVKHEARTVRLKEQDIVRIDYPERFLKDKNDYIAFELDRMLAEAEQSPTQTNNEGRIEIKERPPAVPSATPDATLDKAFGSEYRAFATVRLITTGLTVVSAPENLEQSLVTRSTNWTWIVKAAGDSAQEASFKFQIDIVWRKEGDEKKVSYEWLHKFTAPVGPPVSVTAATYGSRALGAGGLMLMGLGFLRRKKLSPADVDETAEEEVTTSVFAPNQAAPGNSFLVQVFSHLPTDDAAEMESVAKRADKDAELRAAESLEKGIKRGAQLTYILTMPGLEIDEMQQSRVWNGKRLQVQFGVTVPADFAPKEIFGKVVVCENTVPIGHLRFKFAIVQGAARAASAVVSRGAVKEYKQAFISYASQDRSEVIKRVQAFEVVKLKYFLDLLTLEPGDKWEKLIYQHIDESDVFILFWSHAAQQSEWVKKEIMYALQRRHGNEDTPPEIVPVVLPPFTTPPAELNDLHFNDKLIYFMNPPSAD